MKVITSRDKIKGAISSFIRAWGDGSYTADNRNRMVGKELRALDPETATAEQVDEIIGNRSWTRLKCNECDKEVEGLVCIGEEPDYDSQTAFVCFACLREAFDMVKNLS